VKRALAAVGLLCSAAAVLAALAFVHVRPANGLFLVHAHERVVLALLIGDVVLCLAVIAAGIAAVVGWLCGLAWCWQELRR
jgi:hypothetical protein